MIGGVSRARPALPCGLRFRFAGLDLFQVVRLFSHSVSELPLLLFRSVTCCPRQLLVHHAMLYLD
ncbi:hypothetical protein M431DRAFT_381552 [Trichoderma harzianum CBS 226.95]|uniref:Uncharacterized protein n=1 Tax=Trichoderma harzianum CBS 226.95 TaxID=983964 RepID=A0A2T4AHJ3_TRIHA|nr:hypothetical protein M431DRAFT_381552 [Trichoderma harzianum CBS 226.95]PTB56564.1 hypothetical protein M431DRAFT_381552 [Trichoderma harzianum CBS 226.95]